MARTLSAFHYTTIFIDGSTFSGDETFHDEMAFKLGLPRTYARNFDALLECLSSVGNPRGTLCSHWQWRPGKNLVLLVRGLRFHHTDAALVTGFVETVARVNDRLEQTGATVRVWIEFISTDVKRH